MPAVTLIEPLEDRIAPATLTFSNFSKTATYTDATGDTVRITTTKGAFQTGQFSFDNSNNLTELNIAGDGAFTGANIAFTVFPVVSGGAGGSSTVNVGYIDALDVNLGSVTVPGDLGRIDVGGGPTALALGRLTVNSLGAVASSTGTSNITGTIGVINVVGNLEGTLFAQDYRGHVGTGVIGQLNIGGSLYGGGNSAGPGDVFFTGLLGAAVIGGGIEGGSESYSGSIGGYDTTSGGFGTLSRIGSVVVKGSVPDDPNPSSLPGMPGTSILGGSGAETGEIAAVAVGSVYVAGDVFGSVGTASGSIQAGVGLGKVIIGGSLIGGDFPTGDPGVAMSSGIVFGGRSVGSVVIGKSIYGGSGIQSGQVLSMGVIDAVTVMGDVIGGAAGTSSTAGSSGVISADGLGSVVIHGSLIGGNLVFGDSNQTAQGGGGITSNTSIGSLYIGKNVTGGSGASSGSIQALGGGVGSLTIGGADMTDGSLVGGSGTSSGAISADGSIGKLTLAENLTGGSGSSSGMISVNGGLGALIIGGNVTGGTADDTGLISVFGLLRSATIHGGVTGGSSVTAKLTNAGYIQADAIASMIIEGALTSGSVGAGSGGLDTSGAIRSTSAIGSITVGSIVGNSTNPAIISAVGQASLAPHATTDIAIGSITIGSASAPNSTVATYADIMAGYDTNTNGGADPLGTGVNADAQIGAVRINGNIMATNIIAGVGPGTGALSGFGTAASAALSGTGVTDLPSIVSKISQVIITGEAINAPAGSYGIAAEYIVSAAYNGTTVGLKAGPENDTFGNAAGQRLGASGDTVLYEV